MYIFSPHVHTVHRNLFGVRQLMARVFWEPVRLWDIAAPGDGLYPLQEVVILKGQGFLKSFDLHSYLP